MNIDKSAMQERIDMDLRSRSTVGIVIYFVVFPAIFYTFEYFTRHPQLSWGVTLSISGLCILRTLHLVCTPFIYKRFPKAWRTLFLCLVVAQATILGVFFAYVLYETRYNDIFHVLVLLVAGVASGSVTSLSPRLLLAVLYPIVLLVPAIIASMLSAGNYVYLVVLSLYCIYLCVIAKFTNRVYLHNFLIESELKEQKKELERLSRTDALTGIYNRGYFNKLFDVYWNNNMRDKKNLIIMMLDIDHFKKVNDEYGHLAGDKCIITIATLLAERLKRKTDILCRFGGEEFAILLNGTSIADAEKIAEDMCKKISTTQIYHEDLELDVTASIGIASMVPSADIKSTLLIDQADQALYRAKRSGRNCIRCF